MTDKIKSARAYVEAEIVFCKTRLKTVGNPNYPSEFNSENRYKTRLEFWETILEALSAYEKLQGVDRDRLLVDLQVLEDVVRIPDIPAMSCLRKAAQLLADIGGK